MRRKAILFLLPSLLWAGSSMATVLWRPGVTNDITPPDTGDWGDASNWQNGDTNLVDRFMLPDDPRNTNEKAAFPLENRAECVVSDTRNVGKLVLGDNGGAAAPAVLRIVNGGVLNASEQGTWTGIGYNRACILIVEEGGVLNGEITTGSSGGDHLWIGHVSGGQATVEINGGTVICGQMLGIGWNGTGSGEVTINNGGILQTQQMRADLKSISADSLLNVTYTDTNSVSGRLIYFGGTGTTNILADYVAEGRIVANGKEEDVIISYDTNLSAGVVSAVLAPPDPPLSVTAFAGAGGALDLEWSDVPGKQFDLISSETIGSATETWPVYNDGVTTYEDIPNSGTGTNVLAGILPVGGPPRFFAIRKEFGTGIPIFSENFDDGPGLPLDWTTGVNPGDSGSTTWQAGVPTVAGPAAANSLSNCVATTIAGNYGATVDTWLRTPPIPIDVSGGQLVFQQFLEIEPIADAGSVRVLKASDGSPIGSDLLGPVFGTTAGEWEEVALDLPPEAVGETIQVEFQFQADAANALIWNSGFESPVLSSGQQDTEDGPAWFRGRYNACESPNCGPSDWFNNSDFNGGIRNPDGLDDFVSVPEGSQYGFVLGKFDFDVALKQDLGINLEANTQYDLSAQIGSPFSNLSNVEADPDYRIELLAGGELVASDTGPSPAGTMPGNQWALASLTYNSGAAPAQLGEPMEIRLLAVKTGTNVTAGAGQTVAFDDVTLTVQPDPGSIGLAGWYIDDVEITAPIP